jgi:hypothetical protein
MRSITNRIAGIKRCTMIHCCIVTIAIAGCGCVAVGRASAQSSASATVPPAPATYKGCVQKAPGTEGGLLIGTPSACARLTGKVPGDDAVGHEVQLDGILTPRTSLAPASLQVNSVISVGDACSKVCTLPRRGLVSPQDQPKATPGTEGGTPGRVGPPE